MWADCATTSHVTNQRDAFTTFEPLNKTVSGVGNAQTHAKGRGTIKLLSKVNNETFRLTLTNVLYIPTNPQNLLSLGRWDRSGGTYHGGQGSLSMNANNSVTVATGTQINNHLYKLDNFIIQKPEMEIPKLTTPVSHTFATTEPFTSWEMWHRRYGHLGISSIQTLLDKKFVTGLDIDLQSPKYDCEACTLAKQQVAPFPKAATLKVTKPGELTHTDLWGKYPVQSIHRNQYFHTFLDDKTRYPRVRFLKHKDETGQSIKDYVTYLKARGMQPQAFRCDQGTEFINDDLLQWLRQQGIEVQMTAPYSPSQNGAAERLNRTLVELARAMIISRDVPMFLWEYAIQHAAYLRQRASTKILPDITPYEAWHGRKPNVAHLREFGTPVYVLLQGQNKRPKLLPKSKQQIFFGFNDESKSVKYYNPETRKVLTSRNYQFLTNLPKELGTPEPIQVDLPPAVPREGKHDDGYPNPNTLQSGSQCIKRQREEPQTESEEPQRKLRTKTPVNY